MFHVKGKSDDYHLESPAPETPSPVLSRVGLGIDAPFYYDDDGSEQNQKETRL